MNAAQIEALKKECIELRAALRKLSNECDGEKLGTVKAPTWATLCAVETLLTRSEVE